MCPLLHHRPICCELLWLGSVRCLSRDRHTLAKSYQIFFSKTTGPIFFKYGMDFPWSNVYQVGLQFYGILFFVGFFLFICKL